MRYVCTYLDACVHKNIKNVYVYKFRIFFFIFLFQKMPNNCQSVKIFADKENQNFWIFEKSFKAKKYNIFSWIFFVGQLHIGPPS